MEAQQEITLITQLGKTFTKIGNTFTKNGTHKRNLKQKKLKTKKRNMLCCRLRHL
jgi:hypothetical protein